MSETIEKVLMSLLAFRQLSFTGFMTLLILSILRQLLSILILICFVQSLALDIGFSTIGWIRSLMNVVIMLPISFAGLGVREASFAILLEPYGITGPQAVALSLLSFTVYLFLAFIGGLLDLKNTFQPRRMEESNGDFGTTHNSTTEP